MAVPHSVAAQTCTGTDGTPPEFALGSSDTGAIACTGLTGGLTLDLNGAVLGTSETHLTGGALSITATTGGARDVVITGRIATYSQTGIGMERAGTGLLKLVLDEKSIITTSGTGGFGINLKHTGEAGKETSIHLESSATIDVSQATASGKSGIQVTTVGVAEGTTIPITVRLKGGSIRAEGTSLGYGVRILQYAKGDISITVDPGVMIGMEGKSIGRAGIDSVTQPKGDGNLVITHSGHIYANKFGIFASFEPGDTPAGNITIETGADSKIVTSGSGITAELKTDRTGTITVTHKGMIDVDHDGIDAKGFRDITVTTMPGSIIEAEEKGIDAGSEGSSKVTVIHGGMIDASVQGISAYSNGDVTVTLEKGSSIKAKNMGISASSSVNGKVTVTHGGTISSATQQGIYASGRAGGAEVTLKAGSSITAKNQGIAAEAFSGGIITVKTEAGSSIVSDTHGIQVNHIGTEKRQFHVAVYGTVMGGNASCTTTKTGRSKCAGVYVRRSTTTDSKLGGGTIVIGPWAHVKATSGVAIEVDGKAGDVAVILEQDEAGVVGHVEGQIFQPRTAESQNTAADGVVTIKLRGAKENLEDGDHVYRRGDRMGVYEEVIKAKLEEFTGPDEGYYRFDDTTMKWRLYSHRARLYEVLPSVLLGLVDLTPYSTRMAVPRRTTGDEEVMVQSSKGERMAMPGSRTGVWVRLAVRDGERMADTSTTATDFWHQSLAWDVKQTDFEAGLEVPTDERLVLGVSAHYRQSEATVKKGGTMEASGTGVGLSLTWTDDSGLYVDGQLSYTRFFDITMASANSAVGSITSTGGGNGLAVGVEVGQPMSMGGLTVIPRGGLSWSSVDQDAFDEPARIDGAGRVAPDKEQSVQGRVGVLAELGSGEADGRLYASLDLEHEFSSKHAVMVAGTRLATEVKPTWVRLGVGGAMSLDGHDTTLLTGDAFYATAGSDNTDFGGGLAVTFRF